MSRIDVRRLQDIPNIGKAIEKKLLLLGIREPAELIGRDPYKMCNPKNGSWNKVYSATF